MSWFGWRQLIFIIPSIIVVVIFFNRQIEPAAESQQQAGANRGSDYYLHRVQITRIGDDGNIADELFAEILTHYPHDDHSDLRSPRFKIHQTNGGIIWAESDDGVMYGEEKIILIDAVKIEQRTADDRVTNRIEGSEMAIERASKRVTSSAQVTLSGENYSIVAGAMEMLSDEKRLFLSNGVEGYYARQ